MLVLIPCAEGRSFHPNLLSSIRRQTVPCEIVVMVRGDGTRRGEVECRRLCQRYAYGDIVVMMDSDRPLTGPNDIHDMLHCLIDSELDAVALNSKPKDTRKRKADNHVEICCAMYLADALRSINFETINGECLCGCVNNQISIDYIENEEAKQ